MKKNKLHCIFNVGHKLQKICLKAIKQEALDPVKTVSHYSSVDEITHRMYLIDKIHESQIALINGQTIRLVEMGKEMQLWKN